MTMAHAEQHLPDEVAVPQELETAETTKLDLVPEVDSTRREVLERLREEAQGDNLWFREKSA